jgi:uncharacterized protein (TIGR00288 family)
MKPRSGEPEHALAVFIDFENLALGFNGRRDRFEIQRVLERLVEKGKIVVKKAYCDWSRFGQYTGPLHEAAIELIEIPKRSATGKNSADIRLVVDAIDLAYSKDHIDTFCIVSGDSDFSPLVSKLKELGKHVLGLGLANATSELLRDNCDEFIYYEDLGKKPAVVVPAAAGEQGTDLFVHGQGHHEAEEAVVQRGLLRVQHVQRAARRRGETGSGGHRKEQEQRHLCGDAVRQRAEASQAGRSATGRTGDTEQNGPPGRPTADRTTPCEGRGTGG